MNNQIEKSKLKSPVAGTVTKLNFEPGEQYMVGRPMATLISGTDYMIDVDISESDISKIKIGDSVMITLDAFSADIELMGKVNFIEPAETVIQDVVYYRVTIIFDSKNGHMDLVKPGMTANTDITTNQKFDIFSVPGRAIIDRNGDGKFIKTYNNNIIKEKKVEVGIIGDGGMVEILSGLAEGDEIIVSSKEK
jgi:HlyD family secretion protein